MQEAYIDREMTVLEIVLPFICQRLFARIGRVMKITKPLCGDKAHRYLKKFCDPAGKVPIVYNFICQK